MRHLINILLLVMAGALIATGVRSYMDHHQNEANIAETQKSLGRLQQQIAFHAQIEDAPSTVRGFPETIEPDWFVSDLPLNTLVSENRPWLQIAGPDELDLRHPKVRTAEESEIAAFWYNPALGVIRARVPRSLSDAATNEVYDRVNNISHDIAIDPLDVTYERARESVKNVRRNRNASSSSNEDRTVTRRNKAADDSDSKKRVVPRR